MTDKILKSEFRIEAFPSKGWVKIILVILGPVIDRILGFRKLEKFYYKHKLEGLEKEDFVKKVISGLNINCKFDTNFLKSIPETGSMIIVSNHPYGGIEGIILADILSGIRKDVKFMVRNPKYRYLYGTVSLSNIYDPGSMALMHRILIGEKNLVQPVTDINIKIHPEVEEYIKKNKPSIKELDSIIKLIEPDNKGIPVLVKQYAKLGA